MDSLLIRLYLTRISLEILSTRKTLHLVAKLAENAQMVDSLI
nr:MAG TPA: hypothetical protein [Caudoviricetes sp.]